MTAPPPAGLASLPVIDDPTVLGQELLGPGAEGLLAAVLDPIGARVERSRPVEATYHRGRALTVVHAVGVRWSDGRRSDESVVLATGRRPPRPALVVSDGHHDVVVWRVPADPWLPGLGPALDPDRVAEILRGLGLDVPGPLRCRVVAYRPGRRAVVEVTGSGPRTFIKVVRPERAEALHRRHRLLAPHVPVPASWGWSAEHGVVVLQGLSGRTVRDALATTGAPPRPADLLAVLDALPDPGPLGPGPTRPGWRSVEHADHVAALLPSLADRTAALAAGLAPYEAEVEAGPEVPVHGDLHDAQVLVDGGHVVGLLDVDTFGLGHRVDDLATYVGHLVVLATTDPARRHRIEGHARRVLDGFDRVVDPALLRAGVAAVVLGLAPGSFRALDDGWEGHVAHRVALAEEWSASARAARRPVVGHEKDLRVASGAAQLPSPH